MAFDVLISGGRGALADAMGSEMRAQGDQVHAPGRQEMDVRDEASVDAYFAQLDRLDVLVANAGVVRDATLFKLTDEDYNAVIDTNLRGVFLCVRAALRLMLKQRSGHLILIGSRSARSGPRGQAAYAAVQGGADGLSRNRWRGNTAPATFAATSCCRDFWRRPLRPR